MSSLGSWPGLKFCMNGAVGSDVIDAFCDGRIGWMMITNDGMIGHWRGGKLSSAGQVTRGDLPWASRGRGGDLATFLAIGEGTRESWTGDLLWIRFMPPVAIESAPPFDVPTLAE